MDATVIEEILKLNKQKTLAEIRLRQLKEIIKAEYTGIEPETPGGKNYIMDVIRDEWEVFAPTIKVYFLEALHREIEAVNQVKIAAAAKLDAM